MRLPYRGTQYKVSPFTFLAVLGEVISNLVEALLKAVKNFFPGNKKAKPALISNYEIYSQADFNQPSHYPIQQTIAIDRYQPISDWIGQLILPTAAVTQVEDCVLFEVHHAPASYSHLLGQVVNLQWHQDAQVQDYVRFATRDVHFTELTLASQKSGFVHPDRLNGRLRVGPLTSLAGARSRDDMIVTLSDPTVVPDGDPLRLEITSDPVQITGRFYGLVKILKRDPTYRPEVGSNDDANLSVEQMWGRSDRFEVNHFNPHSGQFDGPQETIRIPQAIMDRNISFRSTNRRLEKSPLNDEGWYVYGANDATGTFVVQGIEPRSVMRLSPHQIVLGTEAGLNYIRHQNWNDTPARKGTAQMVLVDPTATNQDDAIAKWQVGDRAIVVQLYGGIAGKKADLQGTLGVVAGHFAFGIARVVQDPLSQQLRFDIDYQQVYGQGVDGIISGAIKWSSYTGDLQRGWLGSRPISDAVVKLDAFTQDYDFDGITVSPMAEFVYQLGVMMARYRTGDGTGGAMIRPATSCVQDANQALYSTIQQIEYLVREQPQIQAWLQTHSDHPQTQRFQKLVELGRSLERNLEPLGIVRSDWQRNTEVLLGVQQSANTTSRDTSLLAALTTWRTMLPRRAYDELLSILLVQGASFWFLRTNQVGGDDPDILPLAPTYLFRDPD
jgi:predicted Abi (CAAX) family protease